MPRRTVKNRLASLDFSFIGPIVVLFVALVAAYK
jgi:hypothetical protein